MIAIDNQTWLDYETVGCFIDRYLRNTINTITNKNKEEYFNAFVGNIPFKITVNYGKNRTKFTIKELK